MKEATLLSTGARPVLRFERHLDRTIEDVWHAVTDPTEMRSWFPTRIEIDEWKEGATLLHHFDEHDIEPIPGEVLAWDPPNRVVFTWGEDTLTFELSEAGDGDGDTTFVLMEELGAAHAARNAAGWEVCLDNLVTGSGGEDWKPRFERYTAEFEPVLGPQEGPPRGYREREH